MLQSGSINRMLPFSLKSPRTVHIPRIKNPNHPLERLAQHAFYFYKPSAETSIKLTTYILIVDLNTQCGQRTAFELLRRLVCQTCNLSVMANQCILHYYLCITW